MKYMLMKTLMLLLMLVTAFVTRAQDDVYFVPTKENKAHDVKGTDEVYFVDVEEYLTDSDSLSFYSDSIDVSYADDMLQQYDDNAYYVDSEELFTDNDFRYSARIVRFRNPDRLLGDRHYWDLLYGYGVNDWLVYDTGYSLDIYPTASNPFYYRNGRWSYPVYGYGWGYTNWTWYMDNCTWYGINNHWAYFTPIWHYCPAWHNHYPVCGHGWHGSWNTAHIVHRDIPTNIYAGKVNQGGTRGERYSSVGTDTGRRGGKPAGQANIRTGRHKLSTDDSSLRETVNNKKRRDLRISGESAGKRFDEKPSMRRQRPVRGIDGTYGKRSDKENENVLAGTLERKYRHHPSRQGAFSQDMWGKRDEQSKGGVRNGRQQKRGSSSGDKVENGSNRRGGSGMNLREQRRNSNYGDGSSSKSYNRPSSTSVSRSRNNSSGSSGSSYRSSGSSSRSSGTSFRSSGSSSRGSGTSFQNSGSSSRGSSGSRGRGGRR